MEKFESQRRTRKEVRRVEHSRLKVFRGPSRGRMLRATEDV
jgi:hypothetical protein